MAINKTLLDYWREVAESEWENGNIKRDLHERKKYVEMSIRVNEIQYEQYKRFQEYSKSNESV